MYAERALRAGAMGYVHKSASWDIVIEAIRTVLQGKRYLSAAAGNRLLNRMLDAKPAQHTDGEVVERRCWWMP